MNKILSLIFILFSLSACSMFNIGPNQYLHNPQRSTEWVGTYQGILPCRSCEGIATMVILNPDYSYTVRSQRLGIDHIDRKTTGTFSWVSADGTIRLKNNGNAEYYRLGRGYIEFVRKNGSRITSSSNSPYILGKTN